MRMPLPETSSVVVSPPMSSSTPCTLTARCVAMRTNSRRWMRSTSPLSETVSEPAFCAVSTPPKRWMPRPDITSTASLVPDEPLDAIVQDGQRDGDARRVAAVDRRRQRPDVDVADDDLLARDERGDGGLRTLRQQLLGERARVGGGGAVARAHVGHGPAGVQRQLERRAGASGLVRVRERDVRRPERGERGGDLGGRGRAERRRQREVDLGRLERLQVRGQLLDVRGRRAGARRRACRSA